MPLLLAVSSAWGQAAPPSPAAAATPPAAPAPQAQPARIAPPTDATGRIPFGRRLSDGKQPGVVTITADRPDVHVYLDGLYFGVAPRTISHVPVGDYIVEAAYPDGKTVSRPIALTEGQILTVQMAARVEPPPTTPLTWNERVRPVTLAMASVGAASLLAGGVVAYFEMSKQDEYDSAPLQTRADQQRLDDLARDGRRLALIANVLFGVGAAGLAGAAVMAYADLKQPVVKESRVALSVRPGGGKSPWGLSLRLRF